MALITSPQHARIIQEYDVGDDGGADPPPFEAEDIPGKGIGLRATRAIARGEVLMVRAPTLIAQEAAIVDLQVSARDRSESSLPLPLPLVLGYCKSFPASPIEFG